ncbi:MAG: MucR family transcriptional regulator [Rhizobiales bacterium NRL2]|jgi:predicted transcriptional regulator|nr:MAG: MucR family transcriptional regulator [Rhizobiales bacterium NRL2]
MDKNDAANEPTSRQDLMEMTSEIVSAYVGNNIVPADEVPNLIRRTFDALDAADKGEEAAAVEPQKPAVPIKRSVTPEHLICLEDGKKLKMLKRYLRTNYDMTPEQYRAKWNLPADYPMVAPNYAKQRAEMAKSIGLGRKGRQAKAAR